MNSKSKFTVRQTKKLSRWDRIMERQIQEAAEAEYRHRSKNGWTDRYGRFRHHGDGLGAAV